MSGMIYAVSPITPTVQFGSRRGWLAASALSLPLILGACHGDSSSRLGSDTTSSGDRTSFTTTTGTTASTTSTSTTTTTDASDDVQIPKGTKCIALTGFTTLLVEPSLIYDFDTNTYDEDFLADYATFMNYDPFQLGGKFKIAFEQNARLLEKYDIDPDTTYAQRSELFSVTVSGCQER